MNVLVLSGGPDAERAVSLRSGTAVADALRTAGQDVHEHVLTDATLELTTLPGTVIFPVLHGPAGLVGSHLNLGRPAPGTHTTPPSQFRAPESRECCDSANYGGG